LSAVNVVQFSLFLFHVIYSCTLCLCGFIKRASTASLRGLFVAVSKRDFTHTLFSIQGILNKGKPHKRFPQSFPTHSQTDFPIVPLAFIAAKTTNHNSQVANKFTKNREKMSIVHVRDHSVQPLSSSVFTPAISYLQADN
jgi:hypothetical protein